MMHFRLPHTFRSACGIGSPWAKGGIHWTSFENDVTCLDCRRALGLVVDDVAVMDIAVRAFGLMDREQQRSTLIWFAHSIVSAGHTWNPDVEFPNAVTKVVQDGR